jgi:hypothetical protein
MASLTEVYEGGAGGPDLRRLYLGVGLFLVGIALTVGGIALGTSTGVASALGFGTYEARELAGIAAGVGLPATFLGVVVVLPQTNLRVNAAAVIGAAVSLFGVALFARVYPDPATWFPNAPYVAGTYFLGSVVTLWGLFTAVANFKTRNDPGGTVELKITEEGETRVVEVEGDGLRQKLGGIGFFGGTPDGDVETQTAGGSSTNAGGTAPHDDGAEVTRDDTGTDSLTERARGGTGGTDSGSFRSGSGGRHHPTAGGATSDGGTTTESDAEFLSDTGADPHPNQDLYCGNCAHFRYVRTDQGMQPYCGLHSEVMDDMDACTEWSPNNQ